MVRRFLEVVPVTCLVGLIAAAVPLIIELLQPLMGRSFDVDDLLCNFAGIMAGYAAARLVQAAKRR